MQHIRVIPVLQIENRKLVKTTQFKSPVYVGDPLNALRVFNEKQVDEIAIVDIGATRSGKMPDFEFIKQLASECFMPLSYGGGITSLEQAVEIFHSGVEKVIIGNAFLKTPELVTQISEKFGAQSVVVSVDVGANWLSVKKAYVKHGSISTDYNPVDFAIRAQQFGADELLLQSITLEGTAKGYDFDIVEKVSKAVSIPVVPLGGASSLIDFAKAVKTGASAVTAGNMFIFKGPHKAVLISYPNQLELRSLFN